MAQKKVTETVEEMALPITADLGLELVDVEFQKEGKDWYLRVFIDKEGGVFIDDCETVSRALSEQLDQIDPIPQNYYLEVSSPGLDRPLKKQRDFDKYKGEEVEIKLYQAVSGKKKFQGELLGLENNIVSVREDTGQVIGFESDKIITVKRVIKF